ncbi:MAG: hypothetical protein WA810_05905 [Maribacter sp.]
MAASLRTQSTRSVTSGLQLVNISWIQPRCARNELDGPVNTKRDIGFLDDFF